MRHSDRMDATKVAISQTSTGSLLDTLKITEEVPYYMMTEMADFRGWILDELEKRNIFYTKSSYLKEKYE